MYPQNIDLVYNLAFIISSILLVGGAVVAFRSG
jgi:hypothetical protein